MIELIETEEPSDLLPCPFCGMELDDADADIFHMSAIAWKMKNGHKYYVRYNEINDGNCYEVHCPTHYGGCGATISGDSQYEAITAWNKRANN